MPSTLKFFIPKIGLALTLFALFCAVAVPAAKADTISLTQSGIFSNDNDRPNVTSFTLMRTSLVRLYTTSTTGGVNANGTVTQGGGFDTILSLFNGSNGSSSATFVADNDGPSPSGNNPDDADFQRTLNPGSYFLVITQYNNFFNVEQGDSLSAGFFYDGADNSNFTANFGCSNGKFCDVDGNNRTPNFTVNVVAQDAPSQPVPEPTTIVLFGIGLAGVTVMTRRRRARSIPRT
jgi:hypothetical protein